MTALERTLKRIVDGGGPPLIRVVPSWRGMVRFTRPRCVECGHVSRPLTAHCELCGEVLRAGN